MDLSLLQDTLSDFATFGKNLGNAFQGVPGLLAGILSFFENFGDLAGETGDNFDTLSS